MEYKSPLEMFYHWEKTRPDKVYLRQPVNNAWHRWTWKRAGEEIRSMAAALLSLQLPPKSNIALLSKNCAHWILCDLAIMMSGHVSVPLNSNLSGKNIRQILEHCDAPVLFVGKLDNWKIIKEELSPNIKCIAFPFSGHMEEEQWQDIINSHAPLKENVIRSGNDCATIIYTSGTTGSAKGVMHKMGNLSFAASNAVSYMKLTEKDIFFSYLPLAHVGERWTVEMTSLYCCGEISFAESIEKFPTNLAEVQPTCFLAVHLIWKKFQQGILKKMPQKKLDILLKVPVISSIIKYKIKKGIGLSKARIIVTAAAPTPVALIEWFDRLGIRILEGYAMTENFGYSHVNPPDKIKIGFVGKPMPECIVKLGTDNEVLVKNDALMDGYYKDPLLTKEAFTNDGFLKTGDEGFIDEEGYLKITGRTKDNFKTSKGKYVVPSQIEMKFSGNTDIEFVCVTGVSLPQPIALVILSENGKVKEKELLHHQFDSLIKNINTLLDAHERLEKIIFLKGQWTTANGMLTPTLKIKRKDIETKYSPMYEYWCSQKGYLIFED